MLIRLIILFPLFASLLAAQYSANPELAGLSIYRLEGLKKIMYEFVDEGKLAGVQTAIIRNGSIGHYDTYGYADIDSKKQLKDDAIFRIYSMTKPIVSVALMMLYEEGKFLLDDPVHKYIPEMKNLRVYKSVFTQNFFGSTLGKIWPLNKLRSVRKTKTHMRIIDLLRHTSGLGYGWGRENY